LSPTIPRENRALLDPAPDLVQIDIEPQRAGTTRPSTLVADAAVGARPADRGRGAPGSASRRMRAARGRPS
jgi:hypothetical protein